jgi:hypothetical protein
MAGLRWLWLIGAAGGIVVLSAALSFGTRRTARWERKGDPSARVATEGYAGNKPNLRRDRYVATDRNSRRVP